MNTWQYLTHKKEIAWNLKECVQNNALKFTITKFIRLLDSERKNYDPNGEEWEMHEQALYNILSKMTKDNLKKYASDHGTEYDHDDTIDWCISICKNLFNGPII